MIPKHDQELLCQLKKGDSVGYDAIFLKYYKALCINAYFLLKDEQAAKDVVQTFFVEVWEKKLYLRLEGDIKNYLYRSVHNRCLNYLRKAETDQKRHTVFHKLLESESFDGGHEYHENVYVALESAIYDLPQKRREALHMVYFLGKKYQDAADSMDISINSLKTHLKIGIKDLRKRIKY